MKGNIAALSGALEALKKGISSAFLQSGAGQRLQELLANAPSLEESQRSELVEMLQSGDAASASSGGSSDQIVGIVSQMLEEMQEALKEAEASEAQAKADFQALMNAKSKEIAAATKAIEEKMQRTGELAVLIVQGKNELKDTE